MNSRLLAGLAPQVKRNCDISDSRYWGYHSICGLLLRLRELYRFEKNLRPWEKAPGGDVTDWIGRREALWEELAEEDFKPLRVGPEELGPFEVERINRRLLGEGLLYGAGYGIYCKPVFFLAELASRETVEGFEVLVSGREHARDLSIHPAMLQGRSIFARRDVAGLLLWEKLEELKATRGETPLRAAFLAYGIDARADAGELGPLMERAAEGELRAYIHHEIGEAVESEKRPLWDEVLSCVVRSRASVFARAVKDALADSSERGMLRHIIDERKAGSLAFYAASLGGHGKLLAPEMAAAFRAFSETGGWEHVEAAREALCERAARIADAVLTAYAENRDPGVLNDALRRELTLLRPA